MAESPDQLVIVLNLPPRVLQRNVRAHWAKKAKARRGYRVHAWALARKALWKAAISSPWQRMKVTYHFYFPVLRQRDHDNLIAWMKAGLDGVADSHLVPRDDDEHVQMQTPTVEIDRAKPRVEIECEQAEAVE